nr:cytochrome c3 family protein [uncultured Desulfobulbus sp.]
MKSIHSVTRLLGACLLAACTLWPLQVLAVENSECMECHSDETLTKKSTDNILQVELTKSLYVDEDAFNHSVHNANGITCVDCHTDIEALNWDEDLPHAATLQPVQCAMCHEESAVEFKDSVHMAMRTKGISMTCYACHGYHNVKQMASASVSERMDYVCLKCHNPYQSHDWLPSKESHFANVDCVVCHSPNAPRHTHLRFFDLATGTYDQTDSLMEKIGVSAKDFMATVDTDKDGAVNQGEFDDLMLRLKLKNIRTVLHAELVAAIDASAHGIVKQGAQKECGQCHSSNSSYFNEVNIVFPNPDGGIVHHKVDRSVLESYYVSHFYLLGGTRIKLLDKIGLIIVAGGVLVVLGHLTMRLLTIPWRRKHAADNK